MTSVMLMARWSLHLLKMGQKFFFLRLNKTNGCFGGCISHEERLLSSCNSSLMSQSHCMCYRGATRAAIAGSLSTGGLQCKLRIKNYRKVSSTGRLTKDLKIGRQTQQKLSIFDSSGGVHSCRRSAKSQRCPIQNSCEQQHSLCAVEHNISNFFPTQIHH